tara:strand:+ start:2631 stop:2975 length:345 start_codon:yes stop_codon:yes gene_type:complete
VTALWSTPTSAHQARNLICKSILATDMAHHSQMVRELTEMAAQQRPVQPVAVLQAFLHLADLSNPVLEWSLSRRWASLVCAEFRNQVSREVAAGMPVTRTGRTSAPAHVMPWAE